MGVLESAIIGGVIGGSVAAVVAFKQSRWHGRFLDALGKGDRDGARAVLDKAAKPHTGGPLPLNKLLAQRARLSGLTLIGDVDALAEETARIEGSAAALGQVKAVGLLGLAVRGDAAAVRPQFDELEHRVHAEANKLQKLIKDKTTQLAVVVRALAGDPLPAEARNKVESWIAGDDKLTRIVMYRALQLALERSGESGALYQHKLGDAAALFG